jgi:hypothetical protein
MKVRYQTGSVLSGELVDRDVRWLVVYDQYEQPIAAIEQIDGDHVLVTSCSDEKFHDVNRLPRTEVVHDRA